MAFDSTGRLAGTRTITTAQEVLRTPALDAGGEPILDTNGPIADVKRAMDETAEYYRLSWRPEEDGVRAREGGSGFVSDEGCGGGEENRPRGKCNAMARHSQSQ